MADEVLYAGGRLDSVEVIAGTPTESTTAALINTTYADAATRAGTNTVFFAVTFRDSSFGATDVVSGESLYLHFDIYHDATASNTSNVVTIYDSSGFPWLALRTTTVSGTMGIYYNSGTGASPTWTLVDSTWSFVALSRYTYDIKLTLGSPHAVEVSRNGSLLKTGTFTQASFTGARSARFSSNNASNATSYSQILATRGINTIGAFVKYLRGTGAGSNSGWTGSVTDVNEAIGSDATVNTSATAGQKQSYAMTDITVPGGYDVRSIFYWLRARNTGAAPGNIKAVCRSGATDYSSSNLTGITSSFSQIGTRYDTDPATATAWTDSGIDAVEFGYESAT